ncbi:MAG: hypothetical protein IJG40_03490 [Oscillospiraceae bacterium]|nr:hypothetical protein [Oscillospiraceae bacterium]
MFSLDRREDNGLPIPYRLHQENFAQAMGISAAEKYERADVGYIDSTCFLLPRLLQTMGKRRASV